MMQKLRLGINIDHVATIRNARGGNHPETLRAAQLVKSIGADSITVHLREDRRHIRDLDVINLAGSIDLPINLEMAATQEMQEIAINLRPHAICLVPEKRQERTTEGGLDAVSGANYLTPFVNKLQENGSRVSLFIEPNIAQVQAAHNIGARAIEIHTGKYCDAIIDNDLETAAIVLENIKLAAKLGCELGMEVHAGHGISYDSVTEIAKIPHIIELNIGHFLIGEAIFVGLEAAILKMRELMDSARGFETI
jgi:pyridoxine 5-phosphate synthase